MLESEILMVDQAMEALRQMLFCERPNPMLDPDSRGQKIDDFELRLAYVRGRINGLSQEFYQEFYCRTNSPYCNNIAVGGRT